MRQSTPFQERKNDLGWSETLLLLLVEEVAGWMVELVLNMKSNAFVMMDAAL